MMSGLDLFTKVHVAISLAAIGSGFIVLFGMIAGKRLDFWTAFYLATTVATSLTGFGFPYHGITPGIILGVISLVLLAVAIYARHTRHLPGIWRPVYVITAVMAFYLNFLVLIIQSFQKVPILHGLAPTQSELPFIIAQLVALASFLVLGVLATIKFRGQPAATV